MKSWLFGFFFSRVPIVSSFPRRDRRSRSRGEAKHGRRTTSGDDRRHQHSRWLTSKYVPKSWRRSGWCSSPSSVSSSLKSALNRRFAAALSCRAFLRVSASTKVTLTLRDFPEIFPFGPFFVLGAMVAETRAQSPACSRRHRRPHEHPPQLRRNESLFGKRRRGPNRRQLLVPSSRQVYTRPLLFTQAVHPIGARNLEGTLYTEGRSTRARPASRSTCGTSGDECSRDRTGGHQYTSFVSSAEANNRPHS